MIFFTGSTEKGKLVAQAAGKNLVPCVLELGGKSPSIVDESANIDLAAKKIALGRFMNAGQVCVAPDYVLVHYQITDKFISALERAIREIWKNGQNISDMGRIVNDFHKDRCCSLLKDHKGTVVIGNANAGDDGNITPTVVLNPARDSALMKDEIFGPILPIYSFSKIDEAIQQINENDKPLVIYYFGSTILNSNLTKLEKSTSSGALVTNETLFQLASPYLPFGGVGGSGYGRYHGKAGFLAFSNQKSVMIKPALNFYPYNSIYPPFTPDKQNRIRFLMRFLGCTQKQFFKRLFWTLVVLYILKQIAVGNLSMKTYRKWKNIFKTVGNLIPMFMK